SADSVGYDLVGQHVGGRYRVVARIGRGGMATVYRAHDDHLGRDVALKVFDRGLASPRDLQRQQEEVRHLAGLAHPGLVTLFDAISDDGGHTVLVLEYVAGSDLRTRLSQGPLPPSTVAAIGRDVAGALAHIHSHNVVHRDVSPGNILLPSHATYDHDIAAKLTDLGIARVIDAGDLTATGTLIGTAAYLSPEQVQGQPVAGPSDVYSLGLVLLECLTGEREFDGPATESAVARLHRDPTTSQQLPPHWRELILAMTARDPGDRPTAAEAADALQTVRSIGDTPAPSATETARLPLADLAASHGLPRLPLLAGGVALLVAILLIVIVTSSSSGWQPPKPVNYPTPAGQLGTHLKQLERAVSPDVPQ
ncbi:MAG: serine/threonine-protein kinase, partial [Marmoricola sp.]